MSESANRVWFDGKHAWFGCVLISITEQEDRMKFTKAEVATNKKLFRKFIGTTAGLRFDMASVELLKLEYFNWLDAHTEKPLTFPCPGCGREMMVKYHLGKEKYYAVCVSDELACNIVSYLETIGFDTKAELSKALND